MEYKDWGHERTDFHPKKFCEKVLIEINCDFVGLALQNNDGPDVKWHYAAGNSNNKYMRITVRYGKGIAGKVIATGSPMIVEGFPQQILGKPLEYPIMLAEKLVTAFAVPIHFNSLPKGVLLVGKRTNQPFSKSEQRAVLKAAKYLEEKMVRGM
ncbi:GAF domain-containing protein [Niallia sp. Krafla_26]|uniref:GAF domain-containing protein n=1 Tax=Niallia sp. Krafla_26 TaxID=3064703 RepID=UPI003D182F4E